jgi:hypothetical protein
VTAFEGRGDDSIGRGRDLLGRSIVPLLTLAALFALGTLLWTLVLRAGFRYPLEWMEGASLEHALRLARGQPIYAAPSAEFVAYLYPPLSYVPFAAATALLGPTLPAARVASLLCLFGTLLLLGRAGARAGGSTLAGLLTAATFALGFGYTGAFLDLVRVDACFVLLLCAALERVVAGRLSAALGLLALCALAKQHGVVLLALVSAACLWESPRKHARALLLSWTGLLSIATCLQLASDGWFARYVVELPGQHRLEPVLLGSFLLVDLGAYLPVLVLGAGLSVARGVPSRALLAFLLGAIAVSALGRAHPGGHDNVRLPAFCVLCVLGVAPLCARALDARGSPGLRAACLLGLLAQLAVLYQPPSFHAPRPLMTRARFDALDAALRRCAQGGTRAARDYAGLGDAPLQHTMALSDLQLGGAHEPLARAASTALLDALAHGRGPAALAVGEHFPALDRVLARAYVPCATVLAPWAASGYTPGATRGHAGTLVQVVYTRRPP